MKTILAGRLILVSLSLTLLSSVPVQSNPFPFVETLGGVAVTDTSIRLGGTANPAATNLIGWFEWGTTTNYGNITSGQSLGSGTNNVDFSVTFTNLATNTTYHFRAMASNVVGVLTGANRTYPALPPFLAIDRQTNVVLSWLKTAPACLLEQTTNLSSANWTTLYGATVSNGNYLVTIPTTNTAFYRLRRMTNGPITPVISFLPEGALVPICPDQPLGCLLPQPLDAEFVYAFDASLTMDPNRRPEDPAPSYHWELFFPPTDNGGAKYASAGISGYFAPLLTIQPNSFPGLTAPASTTNGQWRMKLTVTHRPTDPLSTGTQTTAVRFLFRYINSQVDLVMSAICQNTNSLPGECAEPNAAYTTEPN